VVAPISTPPMIVTEHRASYAGETSSDTDDTLLPNRGGEGARHDPPRSDSGERRDHQAVAAPFSRSLRPRVDSELLGPATALMRCSYLTTSSTSRISGLSDFPVPPLVRDESSPFGYFGGARSVRASGESLDVALPSSSALDGGHYAVRGRGLEGAEDVIDFAAALSSSNMRKSHSVVR